MLGEDEAAMVRARKEEKRKLRLRTASESAMVELFRNMASTAHLTLASRLSRTSGRLGAWGGAGGGACRGPVGGAAPRAALAPH